MRGVNNMQNEGVFRHEANIIGEVHAMYLDMRAQLDRIVELQAVLSTEVMQPLHWVITDMFEIIGGEIPVPIHIDNDTFVDVELLQQIMYALDDANEILGPLQYVITGMHTSTEAPSPNAAFFGGVLMGILGLAFIMLIFLFFNH